jgi:hypothetical protein
MISIIIYFTFIIIIILNKQIINILHYKITKQENQIEI